MSSERQSSKGSSSDEGSEVWLTGEVKPELAAGTEFDDGAHPQGVAAVTVLHFQHIEGLEFHYRDGFSQAHGSCSNAAEQRRDKFTVPYGEDIVTVRYRLSTQKSRDKSLDGIQFVTTGGKSSPFFGSGTGAVVFEKGSKLIGVSGRYGKVMGKLQFAWASGASLQELDLPVREYFDDGFHSGGLESILVQHSNFVWGVQFNYHDGFEEFHGEEYGYLGYWKVPEGERVVCVRSWGNENHTTGLQLVTDKGTESEKFGGTDGDPRLDLGFNLTGVRGSIRDAMGPLEFYWASGQVEVEVPVERPFPSRRPATKPRRVYTGSLKGLFDD